MIIFMIHSTHYGYWLRDSIDSTDDEVVDDDDDDVAMNGTR